MSAGDFYFEEGLPKSRIFEEGYYDILDGLGESRYVFLDGNGLDRPPTASDTLVIAETGFGTGLNLLSLLQRRDTWAQKSPLHFITVEAHPLSASEFRACHQNWPELAPWRNWLMEQWPEPTSGWHKVSCPEASLSVDIFHGDVHDWFGAYPADRVDHWFLDGFSPARNPDMWSQHLFFEMARHSHPGTTLATFTSAGAIRRGLQAVGFKMSRRKGFGKKWEMLTGVFDKNPEKDGSGPSFSG